MVIVMKAKQVLNIRLENNSRLFEIDLRLEVENEFNC